MRGDGDTGATMVAWGCQAQPPAQVTTAGCEVASWSLAGGTLAPALSRGLTLCPQASAASP